MYGHCVLRIRDTDFDSFCGFGKKDHNVTINEYIEVYVNNDNFNAFQIESSGELDLKKIAYISEKIRWANPCFSNMFTKVDFNIDGTPQRYWLCFYKLSGGTQGG